jgi:hypothetical protein
LEICIQERGEELKRVLNITVIRILLLSCSCVYLSAFTLKRWETGRKLSSEQVVDIQAPESITCSSHLPLPARALFGGTAVISSRCVAAAWRIQGVEVLLSEDEKADCGIERERVKTKSDWLSTVQHLLVQP